MDVSTAGTQRKSRHSPVVGSMLSSGNGSIFVISCGPSRSCARGYRSRGARRGEPLRSPAGTGGAESPVRSGTPTDHVDRCSTRSALYAFYAVATGFEQNGPVRGRRNGRFTLKFLAERVRFELTGLSSSGFQGCSRAVARVRQRSI